MSGPKAFSMRRAISAVKAALPRRRSERVARRTFKTSAAFETLRPRASITSVLMRSPGWGGFFMSIVRLLVIVNQVDVAGRIRLFVVAKNQPPVSRNGQTPETVQIALQPMQFPPWKPVHLIHAVGRLQREQQL